MTLQQVLPFQCLVKEITTKELEKAAQTLSASVSVFLNVHLSPTLVTVIC